jgi:hypothetical protein
LILNDCVTEPILVKTVSKVKLSTLVPSLASPLVIKLSFLQDMIHRHNADTMVQLKKNLVKKEFILFICCFADNRKDGNIFKSNFNLPNKRSKAGKSII